MGSQRIRRADTAECVRRLLLLLALMGIPVGALAPAGAGRADPPPAADAGTPVQSVGEVTVTATRSERDVLDVAGNVSVIDRAEIDQSGVATLPDLLRREAGIFVTSTTSNPAGVQVEARGFNNGGSLGSGLLVLVDGRRVNEADTGNTDWALIPLGEIESIEIVRGPVSALYGDNAVGGVIHIHTRSGEGPAQITLRGRVGRYQTGGGSLQASGTEGLASGSLFVEGLDTDAYRHRADFSRTNGTASFEGKPSEYVQFGLEGGLYSDYRQFPGALSAAELQALGRRAASPRSSEDAASVDSRFASGWVRVLPADGVQLRASGFARGREDDATISSISFGQTGIDTTKRGYGGDLQLKVDRPVFGLESRLLAGGEVLVETLHRHTDSAFFTNLFDGDRHVYAGFVQEELALCQQLLLTAGVRYDWAALDLRYVDPDPVFGGQVSDSPHLSVWSPRAALTWRPRPDVSVYASYARGFRLPNFDEDAPLLPLPGETLPTVPDLHAQISDSVEVGAKLRRGRLAAGLALYGMRVKNEITYDPFTFANVNFERTRHAGIEASVAGQALSWLSLYARYTLDDVEIEKDQDPRIEHHRMPITPLHRGSVGFLATGPWHLQLSGNLNVVGDRLLSNDFDHELPKLDPYAVLDLLLAWWPVLGEHLSGALTFAVRNVNGEKYADFGARYDQFDPASGTFVPTAFYNPAATRTWEVGFAITVRQ